MTVFKSRRGRALWMREGDREVEPYIDDFPPEPKPVFVQRVRHEDDRDWTAWVFEILWGIVYVAGIFACVLILIAALVFFTTGVVRWSGLITSAYAHDSWISQGGLRNRAGEWCCGEGDCFVIPDEQVSRDRAGNYVLFGRETVPESEAQPSPDGAYWRCKRPDGTRRCFFAPPPTN